MKNKDKKNKKDKNKSSKSHEDKGKSNIHDAIFSRLTQHNSILKSIITLSFDEERLKFLDLDSIKLEPSNYTDSDLKGSRADLMISVKLKSVPSSLKIMLILEHKSNRDTKLLRQVLKYQVAVYTDPKCIKEKINPHVIVIHQGESRSDPVINFQDVVLDDYPKNIRELFSEGFINFKCSLLNLRKIDILKEVDDPDARFALFVLANIWELDDELYKRALVLIKENRDNLDSQLIRDLLQFMAGFNTRYRDKRVIADLESEVISKKEDRFMGYEFTAFMEEGIEKGIEKGMKKGMEKGIEKGIEQGIEKGIEQGIEKGIEKGKEEGIGIIVRKMLQKNLRIGDIAEYTGLSQEKINLIKSKLNGKPEQ